MKKLIFAALAAALTTPGFAAEYYVVVPMLGRASAAPIAVSLMGTALPAAQSGQAYAGFDFTPWLSVTGDPGFNVSGVTWSLASGALPAGMTLNGNGSLTGTPTAANNYNFTVSATYKGVTGTGAYSLAVKSAASASLAPHDQVGTVIPATGVNDYTAMWLVLTNTGAVPLTIQGLRSSGAPFSLVNRGRLPTSIAPGATANFNVLFQPTAPGSYSGSVTVTTEAGQSTLAVSGDAVNELPPAVDKTSLDFGTVAYGASSSPQIVTVKNVSSVPMGIKGVTLTAQDMSVPWTNEFGMPGLTCFAGSWIQPGQTCSVPVVYAPQSDPNPKFNLTITTPGGTKVIPVTGQAH
ncbi:hypothetical protein WL29_20385 [Burkholderia ubonensis]|uniref:HYDIN/VesB/CFA65-like Ig-like domain-containing protein n=1 Tax=Burkholderia ubonensis TaxID=101571 RepID=A0A106QBB6_9BURK|nr:choice-of-anchor D domain-containing protein [Burkholderia ubonensis]KWA83728.1 hypothetical protein WL29_20385 [Burkholderia ubonensis]